MSVTCSPRVVTDNLIIYLDAANKKSYLRYGDDKWGDMTKYQNHFTKQGTSIVRDQQSYIFPGNNINYFSSLPLTVPSTYPKTELTIEMWIKPNINTSGDALYSFIADNPMKLYHFMYDQTNLKFYGPVSSFSTGISIVNDTWVNVVRTSLRSSGIDKVYINGDLMHTEENFSTGVNFVQAGYVLLGQKPDAIGALDPVFSYAGKIAVFKMYNTVLSDDQVKQNFDALKGRFYF